MTYYAKASRLALLWIVTASVAIPLRYFGTKLRPDKPRPAGRARAYAPLVDTGSVGEMAAVVAAANLFDLPVEDGVIGLRADGPGMPATVSPPSRRVRLSAIIGPPWRAVVVTEGAEATPSVVEVGDTIQTRRVTRITSDSLVLKKGKSVYRYVVAETWLP